MLWKDKVVQEVIYDDAAIEDVATLPRVEPRRQR
jgi:hypothetical protein